MNKINIFDMGYKRVIRVARVHFRDLMLLLLANIFGLGLAVSSAMGCAGHPGVVWRMVFGFSLVLLFVSVVSFVAVSVYCVMAGLAKEDGKSYGYKPMALSEFVGRQVEVVRVPDCVEGLSVGDVVYVRSVGHLRDGGAGVKVKDRNGREVWLAMVCVRLLG